MTVSVVETSQADVYSGSGLTPALSSTPGGSDVLIVAFTSIRPLGARTVSSVVGCGGTWSQAYAAGRTEFWISTDANASGTITIAQSGSGAATATAYLISGLTAVTVTGSNASGTGTSLAGTSINAGVGQIALFEGSAISVTSPSWPSSSTPSSWTATDFTATSSYGGHAHRVPTESPPTSHTVSISTGDSVAQTVTGIVLGDADDGLYVADAAAMADAEATGEYISLATPLDITDATATAIALAYSELVDTDTLAPWTGGASGEALLNLEAVAGVLEVTYPAAEAPAAIADREVPLKWQSHETATVGGDTEGMTSVDVGVPHVWVDGVDVTYFRDAPTKIGGWPTQAPFSWRNTTLRFPKVFHYEEAGTGDLEWMYGDAPVEIAIVTAEGDRIHRFTGHLTSDDPGTGRGRTISEWGVEGALWQADHSIHPVPARLDPTDVGRLIPDELNGTPARRFSPIAPVATGIPSRERGSTGKTRWEYVTDLLSKATVAGGDQWTLEPTGPRSFALVLKDTTTVHWTITAGAPDVELDLTKDHHERIDAVYGRGIGPDGYAWRNVFFPDLLPYDPPAYPYADPDRNVLLGDRDSDTLTGTAISDWQRRIRELGYTSLPVDGVMGSEDIAAVRWIQSKQGIEVDGFMAGQTWAATWNVGAVGGDLRSIRLPLAVRPEVEPYIYGANGAIVGTNAAYDPSIIRHEVDIDFGAGVTKAQGVQMAQRILERGLDTGWVGTVKIRTCPWEGSRWLIDAGDNVLIKGFRGEDILCRVVDCDPDLETLWVTLTVDSEFRDAMAVVQILDRNRESKADPARRPGNPNRRSRMDQDQVTPFEGESPAGRLPKLPLYENHWTVWPVPVSEVGLIAKLRIWTTGPACRFAVALFGMPVTANQIAAKVPDPLAVSNPWQAAGDAWLDSVGWVEGWGEEGQAAGYGMLGSESDGDPVTGVLYDDAGVPYVSLKSPWLWVALYSPTSCFIQGRIYPDPTQ